MRSHGKLIKWNDERGFGFVVLPQSREEIFVHISAFPRDGSRPRIGETISFDIGTGRDGRKRAENVMRPASKPAPTRDRRRSGGDRFSWLSLVLAPVIVAAFAVVGYRSYMPHKVQAQYQPAPARIFQCDGRTHCSQMTSCDEAIYFLKHCPGAQMDGNNDGEPCEQQWCN